MNNGGIIPDGPYKKKKLEEGSIINLCYKDFGKVANSHDSIYQIFLENRPLQNGTMCDYPKTSGRGTLLDLRCHFFGSIDIENMILVQGLYKQNVWQLHLTNDHDWRMEIKSEPELLERPIQIKQVNRGVYGGYIRRERS